VFWGRFVATEPKANAADLKALFGLLAEGKLRPHVAATYPLARGGEAIAALAGREVSGKLVIIPRSES